MLTLPFGLTGGVAVGLVIAAGTASGNVEDHYISIGAAALILIALVTWAIKLTRQFQRIIDGQDESKKDRTEIHERLSTANDKTEQFRDKMDTRLRAIEVSIAGLSCNKNNGKCPEGKPSV